jgi:hypothetical protein
MSSSSTFGHDGHRISLSGYRHDQRCIGFLGVVTARKIADMLVAEKGF